MEKGRVPDTCLAASKRGSLAEERHVMTPEKPGDGQIFLSRLELLTSRDLLPGSDDKWAGSGLE